MDTKIYSTDPDPATVVVLTKPLEPYTHTFGNKEAKSGSREIKKDTGGALSMDDLKLRLAGFDKVPSLFSDDINVEKIAEASPDSTGKEASVTSGEKYACHSESTQ